MLKPISSIPMCLALLISLISSSARAQTTRPEPGSNLTVYLMTIGPGDLAYEQFGHNQIWIHDARRGTDIAFNYGMFDFNQEDFILRFIQGRMLYQMAPLDLESTIQAYRQDNRSIWVQELNLTPTQRLKLDSFLRWNAQPGNRDYRYDYYRDNCSTRVRDALDDVLGGAIRRQSENIPSGTTYRWHTRRLTADDLPLYTALNYVLGEPVDRPISRWEEMFIPMELMKQLRTIKTTDVQGVSVPLVKDEFELFKADRAPEREAPPNRIGEYLLAGLLIGTLFIVTTRLKRWARIVFATLAILWTLLLSAAGLISLWGWLFTDHVVAVRNENLFSFNPLALGILILIVPFVRNKGWTRRPILIFALSLAGLSLLGFAIQALPWFNQINGELIALALPANIALAIAIYRLSGSLGHAREIQT